MSKSDIRHLSEDPMTSRDVPGDREAHATRRAVLGGGVIAAAATAWPVGMHARAQDRTADMSKSNALQLAQNYIRAVEAKDRQAVEAALADNVRQIFPMGAGGWEGLAVIYDGKREVVEYTTSLFDTFATIAWVDKDWTVSQDGKRIFMQARGDIVMAKTGNGYHNTYVARFDVEDGKIVQILEYAIAELFVAQKVEPSEVRIRGRQRAMNLGPRATYLSVPAK